MYKHVRGKSESENEIDSNSMRKTIARQIINECMCGSRVQLVKLV